MFGSTLFLKTKYTDRFHSTILEGFVYVRMRKRNEIWFVWLLNDSYDEVSNLFNDC